MTASCMASLAAANSRAQAAHDVFINACSIVAAAVGARVKERMEQIQRRKPRHRVMFTSSMGDWWLAVQPIGCEKAEVDYMVEDAAIETVMNEALNTFGWDAVPTGELTVVDGIAVGELS